MGKKTILIAVQIIHRKRHTERKNSLPMYGVWQTISESPE